MSSLFTQCLHNTSSQTGYRSVLLYNSTIGSGTRFAACSSTPASSQRHGYATKAKNKGKNGQNNLPRPEFQRDELPHAGRAPVPERSRRIVPESSKRFSSESSKRFSPESSKRFPPESSKRIAPERLRASSASSKSWPSPRDPISRRDTLTQRDTTTRNEMPTYKSGTRAVNKYLTNIVKQKMAREKALAKAQAEGRSALPRRRPGSDSRGDRHLSTYSPSSPTSAEPRRPESQYGEQSKPYLTLSQLIPPTTDTPTTFGNGLREDKELEEGAYDTPETADEFFHPPEPVTLASSRKGKSTSILDADAPSSASFTSPPLLPGFVTALREMFGPNAEPTPIQSLSIAHCLPSKPVAGAPGWKQFLLASETGSGKSIAYLLPLLQGIKRAELAEAEHGASPSSEVEVKSHMQRALNPRGLVLAPTHELARQLSGFAKALLHDVKLRVLCASRANEQSTTKQSDASAAQMAVQFATESTDAQSGTLEVRRQAHPVGVVVGTPMKLLEMVRGRGWDRIEDEAAKAREEEEEEEEDDEDEKGKPRIVPRRGRDKMVHYGTWRAKPELGLANVEWVVVDEADVLFDPDFQETTRTLLADISAARGHVLPAAASIPVPPTLGQPTSPTTLSNPLPASTAPSTTTPTSTSTTPIDYPFNLILTSATIPKSLNAYLSAHHPALVRLASPHLHRLPRTLHTEYVGWTGGNKFADVVRRIKRVWAEDAASGKGRGGELSKVLVFCNRSAKVQEFAEYLEGQAVRTVALTSRSEKRGRGSNRHLDGFLRVRSSASHAPSSPPAATPADPKSDPHVLITTSLLSRGLDFAPDIKHVFIVDEPRNTVDFLHRAGRTGRAGQWGKVVIFGKLKGRGSQRTKEVRKRIQGLRA